MASTLLECFEELEDPRDARGRRHLLGDIVAMAICAVICGAEEWSAMAEFGRAKEKWLRTFLALPFGIPCSDTFRRVCAASVPQSFERCFLAWIAALAGDSKGMLVAVDGKTLRRSVDRANGKAAIHMASAWVSANGLCFGQLATEAKSNEIAALPKLLELLDLRGATVTIDAMGRQKEEEQCRIRKGHGAENVSRLRRIALNLLKQETTNKRGSETKRLRAGWDEQ